MYILGIICAGLYDTMPLIIPSGLKLTDPHASVFNSYEKAYLDDNKFKKKCDLWSIQLIYEYQQNEDVALLKAL